MPWTTPEKDGPANRSPAHGANAVFDDGTAAAPAGPAGLIWRSERRFRSLAEALTGIIWYADARGRMREAIHWTEFTGQTHDDFLGDGWQAMIHPGDRAGIAKRWRDLRASASRRMLEAEFRLRHHAGGYRFVAVRATPVCDAGGGILEWIGGIRDIHEQRCIEQQLREAEAEQRALLDNLPKMVWIADPDGTMRYRNRYWRQYAGSGDAVSWKDVAHPDDLPRGVRAWEEAIREGKPLSVELRLRRAEDGQCRWHLVKGHPLFGERGELRGWYCASTDIEDQKRALATLAASSRRMSRFLAVLSHELRNPLAGVNSAIELLQRADLDDRRRAEAMRTLQRQNLHLQRMVEDLLDISRITQGQLTLRSEPLDLADVLKEVRADSLLRVQGQGPSIDPVDASRPLPVEGDRDRLRQVFDNLLSNAIKASGAGRRIRIESTIAGAFVETRVVDEGEGFPPDAGARLFEPYAQMPDAHSRGLGLGLSIVRTLIELHGGNVAASSDGPGLGATFTVQLPLATGSIARPIAAEAKPANDAPAVPGRVLIVDDEAEAADALKTLLQLDGHDVVLATNIREAVGAASEGGRIDIVLCDLKLSGPRSGHDVARHLRAQSATPPYLVAYSGFGQADDLERSREAGFHEHLIKPASIVAIRSAIRRGMAYRTGAAEA